jgi:DNA-binding MarR family transcriptional regulator
VKANVDATESVGRQSGKPPRRRESGARGGRRARPAVELPLRQPPGRRRDLLFAAAHQANAPRSIRDMTADALDPLFHVPARLQIMATLATLPNGDALSFTRLQDMIGLTPGNLITHLRKLEETDYLTSNKTGSGPASRTSIALTRRGRTALDLYTQTLRGILNGL